MARILYIEDNIDASLVIKLFRKVLTRDLRDEITNAKNQEEILKVISKSNNIDIYTNFIEVLNIIKNINKNSYDLIILDRDLYSILDKNNVKKLGNYDKTLLPEDFDKELFFLREGDYLITILHKKINIDKQLYFLSGNNDDIKEKPQFEYLLSEEFKNNNIFYKTTDDYKRLREVIDNNLCVKYKKHDICGKNIHLKPYVEVLDRYFESDNAVKNFLEITKNKDSDDKTIIKGNLVNLRQLLETHIAKTIINKIENNKQKYFPSWNLELQGVKGVNFGGFISLLNEVKPKMDFKRNREKGYLITTGDEIIELIKNIDSSFNFNINGNYKFSVRALVEFIKLKNENSLKPIKEAKNIEELRFNYLNRFNKELLVNDDIYDYVKYSWNKLSELIHDDKGLTTDGEKFIKNTEKAINTINILYYQLKQIILWFGQVMQKIENENSNVS